MRYTPLNYEQINVAAGTYNPSTQKYDCYSMAYWERALFQRACYSLNITFDNVVTGRERDFILYCLFKYGYVAIWKESEFADRLVLNPCTLYGYNFYYQPTKCIIANPGLIESRELEIGTDCALIKLTPDYMGIWDIIEYYAAKLSSMDPGIDTGIFTTRVPFIWHAKTKGARESLKKFFDKIFKGEVAVGIDDRILQDIGTNGSGNDPFTLLDRPHLKESYLTDLQLKDMQTLINQFDREIGIPTVPYQKKERMVTSEADSTIIDSQARITIWKETLEESFKEVSKLYGVNFTVEARYDILKREEDADVNNEDNINRDGESL